MEIEIDRSALPQNGLLIASMMLIVLVALGALGWWALPDGRILTWTEWQVIRQRAAYSRELRTLAEATEKLIELLEASPDPVRASLVVDQTHRALDDVTLASLDASRAAVLNAADTLNAWALGEADRDEAVVALSAAQDELMQALERAGDE